MRVGRTIMTLNSNLNDVESTLLVWEDLGSSPMYVIYVLFMCFFIYIYIYIYIYIFFFVFGAELRRIKEGFGDSRENFAIVKALSEGKPG